MGEIEERLDPFTMRDALILHDKKIENLNNLFHETQTLVQSFRVSVDALDKRINFGISVTLQDVKEQNTEIEKSIIRLEATMERNYLDLRNGMSITAGKVTEYEQERDKIKDMARSVIIKVATASILAVAATFFTMWVMVNKMQQRLDDDKFQILMHPVKH